MPRGQLSVSINLRVRCSHRPLVFSPETVDSCVEFFFACFCTLQLALETARKKASEVPTGRHSVSVPHWRRYTAVELGFDARANVDSRCVAIAGCCCVFLVQNRGVM